MSRIGIERACFDLRKGDNLDRFKQDPLAYLQEYNLAEAERAAIAAGKVGALFAMNVNLGALEMVATAFRYDNETYVRQLREATGREIRDDQMAVLRARHAARKA